MRPSEKQAHGLLELNRGNTIKMGRTQDGRRYARWKNWRGNTRAGKMQVGTAWAFKKKQWIEPLDIGTGEWKISDDGMGAAMDAMELLGSGVYEKRHKRTVKAQDVLRALESYYSQSGMVLVPEVSLAYQGERRADAIVLGRGNETVIIIEVKVTKQDFKHEVDDEEKRQMALELCSQYFFAAPVGLIKVAELPPEAGLLELSISGQISVTVAAPNKRPGMPTWRLVSAVARALKR